ncbi:metallopeptidase [Nocardia uniformis]|uniref:Metallopeptidase n=1 Tax=Nocardia uniformis TaxID=53432 RepID=A0A849C0Y3_9NOCA|nr:metallopeptidase [Nocardia uniformis]NNH72392.1 metallopeptidase [Nocardia uniformis]
MRKVRVRAVFAAVLLVLGTALTGCEAVQDAAEGLADSTMQNPFEVNGSSSSTGPNGPREGVPDAPLTAVNGDGGPLDTLALNALSDLQKFWATEFNSNFSGSFRTVTGFMSWDSTAARSEAPEFCRETTFQQINAAYCTGDHIIGWDRGILLPELERKFGSMAIVMVLAHEYGHALQGQAGLADHLTPTLVLEQQADCLAGVFLRHVAEGDSPHFTLNTTDGLNSVLGATIAVRDQEPGRSPHEHGSAFERVTAVQIGYTDGASVCKKITRGEIEQRRGTLPTSFQPGEEIVQLDVDVNSLELIAQDLARTFPLSEPPSYDYGGVTRRCPNVTVTQPVSYCPSTNTVGADVSELAKRARGSYTIELLPLEVTGDYNAFVVFVSRYMVALQQDRQLALTGAETAGLRTACLSGAFTTTLSEPGGAVRLSAGDLDEAVSGLLSDGLAASDVNGETVPSGYLRLEAFRAGVLDGEAHCLTAYR